MKTVEKSNLNFVDLALWSSRISQSSNFYNVGVAAQYFGYYHYDYDYEAAQILDTVIKIIF